MFWKSFYEDDIQPEIQVPPGGIEMMIYNVNVRFFFPPKSTINVEWHSCAQISIALVQGVRPFSVKISGLVCVVQSGRSKYKTGVVSFLLCMTYHADITLTYFCIYNEFVTPILKTFVFLSRYPIYRLKPLMNNLRTLATHIDGRKWKIKIFCGRKIFMKSGPSFQHFHKKSHQKCHAILPHS